MQYEVEQKFPVDGLEAVAAKLAELGAAPGEVVAERDLYFRHPARDFAKTDEALRLRCKGDKCLITYKGPKLDATTKTRREIELPLGDAAALDRWRVLLETLGFEPVAEVRKRRRKAQVSCDGREVEASLDDVERVGTFVELELVVDEAEMASAKRTIADLAGRLGLRGSERRSYLELLLKVGERGASAP